MIRCTVAQLALATRGKLLWGNLDMEFDTVSTDSRTLRSGEVFWALNGPNFNGNAFAPNALALGARGLVVGEDVSLDTPPPDTFAVRVADTLDAFGAFAAWYRRAINPRVVAIGGSCGKTTVKDMCEAVLQDSFHVLATQGNFNNLVGAPKTLLRLEPHHTLAVVEVGMNRLGELRRLCEIVDPEVAVLTNIADAHIGCLGSMANLIAAKSELIEGVGDNGLIVVNADCPHSMQATEQLKSSPQILTFGMNTPADVSCEEIVKLSPFGYRLHVRARDEAAWLDLHLFGRFQAYNALASLGVALAMGVDFPTAARRLDQFRPATLRTEIEDFQGIRLVKDCYNASPTATVEALDSLRDLERPNGGRMVVLLGDMLELGNFEELYHHVVGQKAAGLPLDMVVTVGDRARTIHQVVSEAGLPCRHCQSSEEAGAFLGETLRPNDTLFVKGSRLIRLEVAIEHVKSRLGGDPARATHPATPTPVA